MMRVIVDLKLMSRSGPPRADETAFTSGSPAVVNV